MSIDAATVPALPGLSVVIPALDEERGIGPTLELLQEALGELDTDWEIVVVDDGSRDSTAELARDAGARVVSHPQPGGYGRALKTGIVAARYETIAITDADGTYPVGEIPAMVAMLDGYDMIVGARVGVHFRRRISLLSPLRTSFILLASFVTGTWIPDPNSGLRIFRRSQVLPLLPELPRAFSFTTTLTLIMTLAGCFVRYHPVPYARRIGRSKIRLVRDTLRAAQTILEVTLVHNPLKVFLLLGSACLVSAFALLLAVPWGVSLTPGIIMLATAVGVFTVGMLCVVVLHSRR